MARIRIAFPDQVLFSHEVAVRISDLNYGNHLGHDTLLALVHEARAWFFRSFSVEEWDCDGCAMVIADLAVSYRSETVFGQKLMVEIAAGERTASSCELLYRISDRDNGLLAALATTNVVFMDRDSRKVARLPASFVRAITLTED